MFALGTSSCLQNDPAIEMEACSLTASATRRGARGMLLEREFRRVPSIAKATFNLDQLSLQCAVPSVAGVISATMSTSNDQQRLACELTPHAQATRAKESATFTIPQCPSLLYLRLD